VNPLVSIIIPCFNNARYVSDAIRSVLIQTYSPIEILVADDGSTDNTAEVIRDFGSDVIYLHQEHGGVSRARNRALTKAKGAFVGFLDADDCFYPTKIEKQIRLFLERPQLGFVYCGWRLVHDGDFTQLIQLTPHEQHNFQDELLTHSLFASSTPVLSRKAVEQTGLFDRKTEHCEDRDYWLRSAIRGVSFGCVPEILTWARDHDDSASHNEEVMYRGRLAVLEKHGRELEEKVLLGKRSRIHLGACVFYLRNNDEANAVNALKKALSDKPNLLEKQTVLESAAVALKGNSYKKSVDSKDAASALEYLLDLAGPYSSDIHKKRQRFFSQLVLARLSRRDGDKRQCRKACIDAIRLGFLTRIPFGYVWEVLKMVIASFILTGSSRQPNSTNRPEVFTPPGNRKWQKR